jgi:2-oxoglutarate dehydrogenase E2 component (dihydrolipoamide succinyltransferase)
VPFNVVVPELGESVVEARVLRWLKQPGDPVAFGEPLVELETEKTNMEVSADRAGVLAQVTRAAGEDVLVGDVIGVLEESEGRPASDGATRAKAAAPTPAASPEPAPPIERSGNGPRARTTPTARKVAAEHAVEPSRVPGTGDAGRVMKRDIESFVERGRPAGAAAPRPHARPPGERSEERVRMSKRRATIARNLVQAQQTAAMLTTFNEVDMSALMALRERRKQAFKERYGVTLGLTSFFVKASVAALRAFPRLNAEIQGDEMVLKHYYDIGVAVGASQGLVVPVLRDADRLSFAEIETSVRAFAQQAEDGTLSIDDLRGGTFTLTNGGVFGSMLSTPILNPPQVGILGLHKIQERPVVVSGSVVVRPVMYVALTYDHRIVDGREAVLFLVKIKELVEDPGYLLVEG